MNDIFKEGDQEKIDYYNMLNRFQTHCDKFLSLLPIKDNPYKKISSDITQLFLKHGREQVL